MRFPLIQQGFQNPRGRRLLAFPLVVAVAATAAWVCDDAFIAMRPVHDLREERGLTWNPGERVPVFARPLWLALLAAALLLCLWAPRNQVTLP